MNERKINKQQLKKIFVKLHENTTLRPSEETTPTQDVINYFDYFLRNVDNVAVEDVYYGTIDKQKLWGLNHLQYPDGFVSSSQDFNRLYVIGLINLAVQQARKENNFYE